MRVVVTGGAGFVGSHLCDAYIARGDQVVCVDNLSSGNLANVYPLRGNPGFSFLEADVRHEPVVEGDVDAVLHFASPASPKYYLAHPLLTMETGSLGTKWCVELARRHGARFLVASTSEVYGDPVVHPQVESYWGNVNPIGERSVYDEAKRYAEAMTAMYRRHFDVNTAIIRIFNTYGPRMHADDGRVVSTFIRQAIAGEPLTVFGAGDQTRSFCHVTDLVAGIIAMVDSDAAGPINLGNPNEFSILQLAEEVLRQTDAASVLEHRPLPSDDPTRRRPDISRATKLLGWSPSIQLAEGVADTIAWFRTTCP